MLRTHFPMLRTLFHVAPPPSSPDIVYMLRVCGERVASLWQACCDQHPNIVLRVPFPCCEHLFPCCEHFFHVAPPPSSLDIVYMLRVMLRACGEHVASLWRACCDHHPNIRCKVDGRLGERLICFPRRMPDQEHYRSKFSEALTKM
jgi:hypothetical protein